MSNQPRPTEEQFRDRSREMYADPSDDGIEIDEGAEVTDNEEDGAWVQARTFVRYSDVDGFE